MSNAEELIAAVWSRCLDRAKQLPIYYGAITIAPLIHACGMAYAFMKRRHTGMTGAQPSF